jgi:hypothetical protein
LVVGVSVAVAVPGVGEVAGGTSGAVAGELDAAPSATALATPIDATMPSIVVTPRPALAIRDPRAA